MHFMARFCQMIGISLGAVYLWQYYVDKNHSYDLTFWGCIVMMIVAYMFAREA